MLGKLAGGLIPLFSFLLLKKSTSTQLLDSLNLVTFKASNNPVPTEKPTHSRPTSQLIRTYIPSWIGATADGESDSLPRVKIHEVLDLGFQAISRLSCGEEGKGVVEHVVLWQCM